MIQAPLIYPASNSVYWTGCLAIVLAGISTNRDCFRIAKLSTDHMCSFHVEACLAHCSKLALVSKFYPSFILCFTSHKSDFTTIATCIFKVATMKLVHYYTVVTNNQQWSGYGLIAIGYNSNIKKVKLPECYVHWFCMAIRGSIYTQFKQHILTQEKVCCFFCLQNEHVFCVLI